jgi:hypothetical protein
MIPVMHNISDYAFENPLISATAIDDCTMISSSADAIFSSDSMQSITVCKIDAPVNEIIIPSAESIVEAPIIEAPIVEAPIVEAPKVIEVPKIVEAPKVAEVPKVVEALQTEVLPVESTPEEEKANGEEEEEEEEEEGEEVEEITYNGETYYKDGDGFIYKPDDDTPIGYWKEKTQSIAFYRIKK